MSSFLPEPQLARLPKPHRRRSDRKQGRLVEDATRYNLLAERLRQGGDEAAIRAELELPPPELETPDGTPVVDADPRVARGHEILAQRNNPADAQAKRAYLSEQAGLTLEELDTLSDQDVDAILRKELEAERPLTPAEEAAAIANRPPVEKWDGAKQAKAAQDWNRERYYGHKAGETDE